MTRSNEGKFPSPGMHLAANRQGQPRGAFSTDESCADWGGEPTALERSTIHLLAKRGKSHRGIAQDLGRGRNTIAR